MDLETLLSELNPERYQVLKRCVELGKWPDGRRLSSDEQGTALQVLIRWEARHKPPEERIGYIPPVNESDCDHDHDDHTESALPEKNLIYKSQ